MSTPDEELATPGRLPEDGIAERIRGAREHLGLSQAKLAELTKTKDRFERRGIPRSVLVGYESGKYKPGARELRLLSDALAMDVSTLLLGSGDELQRDMDRALNMIAAGGLGNALPAAIRTAIGFMRLKDHEREAFASLIRSMVVRSVKDSEEVAKLDELADLLAIELTYLLEEAPGSLDANAVNKALLSGKGLDNLVAAVSHMVDRR